MLLGPKFTGTGTTKCTWSNLNIEQAGIGIGFYLKISHFWIENDQNILLKLISVQNWCIIPRIKKIILKKIVFLVFKECSNDEDNI